MTVRRQLSLLAPEPERSVIDAVRRKYDTQQHAIIPAHATLCRDGELEPWSRLEKRLRSLERVEIVFELGDPNRDEWGGIYIPMRNSRVKFDELRRRLLGDELGPRIPHITILHPRHARANEAALDSVRAEALPDAVTFREISLIEQRGGGPWRALNTYPKRESV